VPRQVNCADHKPQSKCVAHHVLTVYLTKLGAKATEETSSLTSITGNGDRPRVELSAAFWKFYAESHT